MLVFNFMYLDLFIRNYPPTTTCTASSIRRTVFYAPVNNINLTVYHDRPISTIYNTIYFIIPPMLYGARGGLESTVV